MILRKLPLAAAMALIGGVALFVLGFIVRGWSADEVVTQWFTQSQDTLWGSIAVGIYMVFAPRWAPVIVIAIAALIAFARRSLRAGLQFGLTVGLTWLPVLFVKMIIHRPRPVALKLVHPQLGPPSDWSFPSGHTTIITALVVTALLYSLARHGRPSRWLLVLAPLAIVAIVTTVWTVGVHYPTDTLGSLLWVLLASPFVWQIVSWALGLRTPQRALPPARH